MMLTHAGCCNPSMLFAEPLWSCGSPAQKPTVMSVRTEPARVLELKAGFSIFLH